MKHKFLDFFKSIGFLFKKRPVISSVFTALMINLLIESLARHSFFDAVVHLCTNPLVFLYNSTIIFMTLTIAFIFKRRNFALALISILWASLGIINCIVLLFRTTPLSLVDFFIIRNALNMLPVYLGIFEIILIALWVSALITLIVVAWRKLPKNQVVLKKTIPLLLCSVMTVVLTSSISTSVAARNNDFAVLTKAYDNWGFVYCFSRGLIDSGIDKPSFYSEEAVNEAVEKINVPQKSEEVLPNIIVLQLESFFDVSYLKNYTASENPIPTFTEIKNNWPSGLLTMPSIGGGTANSEFEVLTGIDLDFFGIGEYPYQTVLKKTPCTSMARTLKDKGYSTTALHNHTAIFYKRNQVYKSLGFDRFTSVEFMDLKERNELGWAKDTILYDEITNTLLATPERDFIFTVTMQGHGKYPTEELEYEKVITMDGFDIENEEQQELKCGVEFYVNQLRQTDEIIRQLIETFKNYPEPVALVLYGDHLPAFDFTDEDLSGVGIYQTEYTIWTNYKTLEPEKEDLYAYQLNSLIFDKLELNGDIFSRATSALKNEEGYLDTLSLLAYDVLYGDRYSLNKEELNRSDMQMGLNPIKVSGIEVRDNTALVYGEGFTKYSDVLIDGERVNTGYIDWNTLKINKKHLKPEKFLISVAQFNKQGNNLGESAPLVISPQIVYLPEQDTVIE